MLVMGDFNRVFIVDSVTTELAWASWSPKWLCLFQRQAGLEPKPVADSVYSYVTKDGKRSEVS